MTRRTAIEHCYVEFIPKDLNDGMLYISNRFKTASHLCCCGCGNKVVTPLNPSKWRLIDHGSTVSLEPSIGLGVLPCRSHYWIRQSRIDWYPSMTYGETQRAQRADHYTSQVYTGEIKPPPPPPPPAPSTPPGWWQRLIAWVATLFKRAK